eukprot:gene27715-7359_t
MDSEAHSGRRLSQDAEGNINRRKKKKSPPPPLGLAVPPTTIVGTLLATSGHDGTTYDLVLDDGTFYIVKLPDCPNHLILKASGVVYEPVPIGGMIALGCTQVVLGSTTNTRVCVGMGLAILLQEPELIPNLLASTGEQTSGLSIRPLVVLLTADSCEGMSQPIMPSAARGYFEAVAEMMQTCSYNKLTMDTEALNVIEIDFPRCDLLKDCDALGISDEAWIHTSELLGSDKAGRYSHWSIVVPEGSGCDRSWAALAQVGSAYNANLGRPTTTWFSTAEFGIQRTSTIMQELLHNFGIYHGSRDSVEEGLCECHQLRSCWRDSCHQEYGDFSTCMGYGDACPSAVESYRLNWAEAVAVMKESNFDAGEWRALDVYATYVGPESAIIVESNWLGDDYQYNLYFSLRVNKGGDVNLDSEFVGKVSVHSIGDAVLYTSGGDDSDCIFRIAGSGGVSHYAGDCGRAGDNGPDPADPASGTIRGLVMLPSGDLLAAVDTRLTLLASGLLKVLGANSTADRDVELPVTVRGLAADESGIYVSAQSCILLLEPSTFEEVEVLGSCAVVGSRNGAGADARFDDIGGIALDSVQGLLYVSETETHCIRVVNPAFEVQAFAGACGASNNGSAGGSGPAASFSSPRGIAVDLPGCCVSGRYWQPLHSKDCTPRRFCCYATTTPSTSSTCFFKPDFSTRPSSPSSVSRTSKSTTSTSTTNPSSAITLSTLTLSTLSLSTLSLSSIPLSPSTLSTGTRSTLTTFPFSPIPISPSSPFSISTGPFSPITLSPIAISSITLSSSPDYPEYPVYVQSPDYPEYPVYVQSPDYPEYPVYVQSPDYPEYVQSPDYPDYPEYVQSPDYPDYPEYVQSPDYPDYPDGYLDLR